MVWCGVVWSTPLGLPGNMHMHAPNIQQVAEEKEEEDTPHIDTWRNARVWADFFDGLH
jgi:hypothetical protein